MPHALPPGAARTMSSFILVGIVGLSLGSIFRTWNNYRQSRIATEKRLLEDIVGLSRAIEKKEKEIKALQGRLTAASTEVVDKNQTISNLERQVEQAWREVADKEHSAKEVDEQNQQLTRELEVAREAASNGKVAHASEDSASSEGTGISVDTRPLISDRLSTADVMGNLSALNAEVLQLAFAMSEYFASPDIPRQDDGDEVDAEAVRQAVEVIGDDMVVWLRSGRNNRKSKFLRVAFQACMSAFSDWMASSWYFEDPDSEQFLTKIYEKIRETESQAVAGQWRVLTRRHVQRLLQNRPDIAEYFLDAFSNILMAIGFGSDQAQMQDVIRSEFGDRMGKIGSLALDLNKAIGEGIVSSEIEPIYVAPGVAFDPAVMDDDELFTNDLPDSPSESETILCTTRLGLLWTGEGSAESRWDEKILLRPRIVRRSQML
ncbi:hypothetical protein EYR40_006375 [Pleurotus pulmonarius]|nr:hypothetical protein EYR36_010996 [Pleurotus pulmonarius]KAF4599283.1 hypothetical protein EYR40_006375 [Pleurotus pulmonarius]